MSYSSLFSEYFWDVLFRVTTVPGSTFWKSRKRRRPWLIGSRPGTMIPTSTHHQRLHQVTQKVNTFFRWNMVHHTFTSCCPSRKILQSKSVPKPVFWCVASKQWLNSDSPSDEDIIVTDIRPGGPQKRTTPPGTGRDSAEPNPKRPAWMEKNEEVKSDYPSLF